MHRAIRHANAGFSAGSTLVNLRESAPTPLGRLKARGFLRGDGGETGAGTYDPGDPRPRVVLGHRPPGRAERHRLLLARGPARHRPPASRAHRRGARPRRDRCRRGHRSLGTPSTTHRVTTAPEPTHPSSARPCPSRRFPRHCVSVRCGPRPIAAVVSNERTGSSPKGERPRSAGRGGESFRTGSGR